MEPSTTITMTQFSAEAVPRALNQIQRALKYLEMLGEVEDEEDFILIGLVAHTIFTWV